MQNTVKLFKIQILLKSQCFRSQALNEPLFHSLSSEHFNVMFLGIQLKSWMLRLSGKEV